MNNGCSKESVRAYPIPVVRLIVQAEQGEILLLKRYPEGIGGGLWCLPGGKVEFGQTLREAAAAELKEETGLDIQCARFLFYQDDLPDDGGGGHYLSLYFACEARGKMALNHESTEYAWVIPQYLDKYKIAFGNDTALRRWLERAR